MGFVRKVGCFALGRIPSDGEELGWSFLRSVRGRFDLVSVILEAEPESITKSYLGLAGIVNGVRSNCQLVPIR